MRYLSFGPEHHHIVSLLIVRYSWLYFYSLYEIADHCRILKSVDEGVIGV